VVQFRHSTQQVSGSLFNCKLNPCVGVRRSQFLDQRHHEHGVAQMGRQMHDEQMQPIAPILWQYT
jgi:hypothetical protein